MELTQEHFDKQLEELHKRLDNMITKVELAAIGDEMATKADLRNQTQELETYTDSVAATIIEAVDNRFQTLTKGQMSRDKKLEVIEKDIQELKKVVRLSS